MSFRSRCIRLLVSVIAFIALWLLVPRAQFLPRLVEAAGNAAGSSNNAAAFLLFLFAVLLQALPTAAFIAVETALVYNFAAFRVGVVKGLVLVAACLASLAAIMTAVVWQFDIAAKLGHYPDLREHFALFGLYYGPLKMLYSLVLIFLAATIGCMVALRIRDKNILLPVVLFAAYVDFWTVTRGPVNAVMKQAPEVVSAVSAPIPQAGTGTFQPVAMIGPGDFLFMAIVFAAVHRLSMRPARNFWFVLAAMGIGMLAVVFGLLDFLPALIVLAVAVAAANWREFKLTRHEKISTAIVAFVLILSLPIIWSLFSREPQPSADRKSQPSTDRPVQKAR